MIRCYIKSSNKTCPFCRGAFLGYGRAVYCCLFCAFWDHVAPPNENDCCLWTGARNTAGYGKLTFGGKQYYATEVCLFLHTVEPVKYTERMHSCDVKRCVALEHLQRGTKAENMQQAAQRGLLGRG